MRPQSKRPHRCDHSGARKGEAKGSVTNREKNSSAMWGELPDFMQPASGAIPLIERASRVLNPRSLRGVGPIAAYLDGPFHRGTRGDSMTVKDSCGRRVCVVQLSGVDDAVNESVADLIAEALTVRWGMWQELEAA